MQQVAVVVVGDGSDAVTAREKHGKRTSRRGRRGVEWTSAAAFYRAWNEPGWIYELLRRRVIVRVAGGEWSSARRGAAAEASR